MSICGDFPGWPVVKTPAPNAGVADSISGWANKIPHACGMAKNKFKCLFFLMPLYFFFFAEAFYIFAESIFSFVLNVFIFH